MYIFFLATRAHIDLSATSGSDPERSEDKRGRIDFEAFINEMRDDYAESYLGAVWRRPSAEALCIPAYHGWGGEKEEREEEARQGSG